MRERQVVGNPGRRCFRDRRRTVHAAETLTILWAQWDPANYLQDWSRTTRS